MLLHTKEMRMIRKPYPYRQNVFGEGGIKNRKTIDVKIINVRQTSSLH